MGKKINRDQTVIEKLTHEIAQLKRLKFAKRSEQMNPELASLLDDLIDTDIAAIEAELQALQKAPTATDKKQKPKRTALPAEFPRTLIHHEPDNTHCQCGCVLKRIGEDVSEKLDYAPGVFTVERHVRGKWVCDGCETLIQAPVPAQVIDKGIPTARLLAHVMIAKFADHLPLYRQESIFGRAGLRFHVQGWLNGFALMASNCSLWSIRCATWYSGSRSFTPMKHRYRCSLRARRKPTVLMCGPTRLLQVAMREIGVGFYDYGQSKCSTSRHIERCVRRCPDESHTSTALSSRPIRSMTASVSTLVLIISRGRFEPSPRTGVLIHSVAAATSFPKRERASSKTATNATRRSLSTVLNRPAFSLRAIVVGDMQIALEITPRGTCRRLATRSRNSKGSPS